MNRGIEDQIVRGITEHIQEQIEKGVRDWIVAIGKDPDLIEKRIRKLESLLAEVDKHLCERIIDPCGYDPEKESREDLITLVKSLSEENEALLKKIRS